MTNSPVTLESLERRIRQLHRSQQRLRFTLAVLFCGAGALAFTESRQDTSRVMRTQTLEFVDPTGKTIGDISGRVVQLGADTAGLEESSDRRLVMTLRTARNRPASVVEVGTDFERAYMNRDGMVETRVPFLRLRDASGSVTALLGGAFKVRPAQ